MIWVELHCDYVTKGDIDCYSHVGDTPGQRVRLVTAVEPVLANMLRVAKSNGWRRTVKHGLICPACVKYIQQRVKERTQ